MNKPDEVFSAGAIRASVFMNERKVDGKTVKIPSISLQKRYRDEKGEWKSTSSLNAADIPKTMLVLLKAYDYVVGLPSDIEGDEAVFEADDSPQ